MDKEAAQIKKLQQEINALKVEHNVVLFAHNYQRREIQDIADVIGDSLYLAKKIRKYPVGAKIVYAAVRFMAETAKILNPDTHIYFPVPDAKCPMAAFGTPELLQKYRIDHPGIPIVYYINSTSKAKQYVDVICTSSNAVEICRKILAEFGVNRLAFGPDRNLGLYVQQKLGIEIDFLPDEGHCYVHDQFTVEDLQSFREEHPKAKILVHPECRPEITAMADFIGSTSAMYNYAVNHSEFEIGIGTEIGLLERLQRDHPKLNLLPIKSRAICYSMKKFTLEAILYCLQNLENIEFQLEVPAEVQAKALKPIQKMFSLMEQ